MGEFPASGPFLRTLTCLGGWEAGELVFHGFDPWSGKIPHAMEQLRPWVTATEAHMF